VTLVCNPSYSDGDWEDHVSRAKRETPISNNKPGVPVSSGRR
jgi:hypothetical protein